MNIEIMEETAERCRIVLSDSHIQFAKECYEQGFVQGLIKQLNEDERAFAVTYDRVVKESEVEDIVLYITGNNTEQPPQKLIDAWAVWNEALHHAGKADLR